MNPVHVCLCVLVLGSSILSTVNGSWLRAYVKKVINDPRSTSLTINGKHIDDDGAHIIAELMATDKFKNTKITSLELPGNFINDEGVRALAVVLPKTKITRLNLNKNRIRADGVRDIADILKSSAITDLSLEGNSISRERSEILIDALLGTKIISLNLGQNGIGDVGARALARILPDTGITTLNLESNHIRVGGIEDIAGAMNKLTWLNLGHNRAGDEGAGAIAEALKNSPMLLSLNLAGTGITDAGACALTAAMKNTQIMNLNLDHNEIGEIGGKCLADVLEDSLMTRLSVRDNNLQMDFFAPKLRSILNRNQKIVDETYPWFVKFVGNNKFIIDEESEAIDYIHFTKTISSKKQSWINQLVSRGGKIQRKPEIEDFVEKIEDRLEEFLHNLDEDVIGRVKLLLECEKVGLTKVVDKLLDHRPDYALRKRAKKRKHPLNDVLHPAVYILLGKYEKPLDLKGVEYTSNKDLAKIFTNEEWDGFIKEEQLGEFAENYGKNQLLKMIASMEG